MAKIVFEPEVAPTHSCQREIEELEVERYKHDQTYLPQGTVVECSCDIRYQLSEVPRNSYPKDSYRSYFLRSDLVWIIDRSKR